MRALLVTLLLCSFPALADRVYVRDRLYPGIVNGSGLEAVLELEPLETALGRPLLDVRQIVVRDRVFVQVADLARTDGLSVQVDRRQDTITIKLSESRGPWILLHFTANWCGPCRDLQPLLVRAAQAVRCQVVTVDLEAEGSPDYRRYRRYFTGRQLPYLVMLDPAQRATGRWTGSPSYEDLLRELRTVKPR